MVYLFWICLGLIIYTYFVYPFLVILISKFSSKTEPDSSVEYPFVTIVIPAYNEEEVMSEKIANCQALEYPADRIQFLFGSDGSTDNTNQILEAINHPQFQAHIYPQREGKSSVLNKLTQEAKGDILLFSDANSLYHPDAVVNLVKHFTNPKVGGVCGKLKLVNPGGDPAGQGEGLYWRYENKLKEAEGQIHSVISANGAIFAIRKHFYQPVPINKPVNDDLMITFAVLKGGAVVRYEPEAIAKEMTSPCMKGEFTRKVRISSLNYNGVPEMMELFHPKYGFTALALFSHKLIRWLVPFLALGVLMSNLSLLGEEYLYTYTMIGQMVVYLGALLGYLGDRWLDRSGPFLLFYYLTMINLALVVGFWRSLTGSQDLAWKRVLHH